MDWKLIIQQIIIALITTTLGSYLTYKKAIKESDNKIKEVRIHANNEIKRIQEESNKEIARIEAECMAKIMEKDQDVKNEALLKVLDNPKKFDDLFNLYKKTQKMQKSK